MKLNVMVRNIIDINNIGIDSYEILRNWYLFQLI